MQIQGAEATVKINGEVVKERKEKKYRHPDLDKRLRTERTQTEAHLIKEAGRAGANVPEILEESETTLRMEKIDGSTLKERLEENIELMKDLGRNVAAIHSKDIIHGDLTTSNAMVADKVYLIDFGLAERSQRNEDKAVDIHLLKQVLNTSHAGVAEEAWENFVEGYNEYDKSGVVLEQLEEVEKRGRYK
jgi:N6-L-threonylcarbamoyladenine synthase/protein kinase Bud32